MARHRYVSWVVTLDVAGTAPEVPPRQHMFGARDGAEQAFWQLRREYASKLRPDAGGRLTLRQVTR